jgi:hypothetical protein
MVDDAPIRFLWHSLVEAAVTGFHMENGDLPSFSRDHGQAAVRVPEDQHGLRIFLNQDPVDGLNDISDGFSHATGSATKKMARFSDAKVVEEDLV